jgi:transcriptional regulator with XRE-family HTH domain
MKNVRKYAEIIPELFALRLKELRTDYDITQNDLAFSLGVTRVHIVRLENCKTLPTVTLVKLISLTYNVNTEWLCGFSEDKTLLPFR